MAYVEGELRNQVALFPETIDDYIEENNPVQFIEVFVNKLNLKELGFKHAELKATGRPPYNPADMLKLYIYGYLNRVRSSRCLEKEANRNLELMWLLKKLAPDFKTIADFRKDNKEVIKGVYQKFTFLCKSLDLYDGELIAVDGSKFKAVNSNKRNFDKKRLEKKIKETEESINRYLDELDANDKAEGNVKEVSAEKLAEKIKKFKEQKQKQEKILKQLKDSGEKQISLTDPDSRMMLNNHKFEMCYNVQMAVDKRHKLIIDYEVTNAGNDQALLSKMSKKAREVLGKEKIEVLADKGYYNALEIKECVDSGITPYIPEPEFSPTRGADIPRPEFYRDKFRYDKDLDEYICPKENKLKFKGMTNKNGKNMRAYEGIRCKSCGVRNRCTKSNDGRRVYRWEHEEILELMSERISREPEKAKMRKELIEHVFGTIKRGLNQEHMLLKGLKKVTAEMGLTALAYNMKRVFNIVGTKGLIMAMG